MSEAVKIVLSLSLSGSLLILALLLCKLFYKNRTSMRWQYYIWLVVVARLLLPFAPEASLVGMVFRPVSQAAVASQPEEQPPTLPGLKDGTAGVAAKQEEPPSASLPPVRSALAVVVQNLGLLWLAVASVLLVRKITIYQSFVKYVQSGRGEITNIHLWEQLGRLVEKTGGKKPVALYTNSLISSPLLIGFFHPCIMLPSAELSDSDFQHTILHELTHYKRRDMFYKWLVQVTICLHWFNPLSYLMGREISRACELSCDEAVIKQLDGTARRAYGDTLLNAVGGAGGYKDSLASITLSENKELLKERLDAIMTYSKKTKPVIFVSLLLAATICFGAVFTGAYVAAPSQTWPLSAQKDGGQAPASAAPPQSSGSDSAAPDGMLFYATDSSGNVHIPVSIGTLGGDEEICIGQVPNLKGTVSYKYDVRAESGGGILYVGLRKAIRDDGAWYGYVGLGGRAVVYESPIGVDSDYTGNYSVFISSKSGSLADISGSVTLQYEAEDSPPEMHTVTIGKRTIHFVDSEAHLRAIGTGKYTMDLNYSLNRDIPLTKEWSAIGTPEKPFTGTFNGNGYEIQNLKNTDPDAVYIGLFGYAKNAEIYNVTLRNVDIASAGGAGKHVGAIAAIAEDCEIYDNYILNDSVEDGKGTVVFTLQSNGKRSIHQSSYFEVKGNQHLNIEVQSTITGGSVDLFLFSPSKEETRFTFGGEADVPSELSLTEGTWAYNCTGSFTGGEFTAVGTI